MQRLEVSCAVRHIYRSLGVKRVNDALTHKLWTGVAQSVLRLAMGWTVRESNPGGWRDFPHPSRLALRPTQPSVKWVTGLSCGVKRPGRDVDHPSPSKAEV